MIPGAVFAVFDSPEVFGYKTLTTFLTGFLATCLVASSNYTINEILDAPMDAMHPVKRYRPVPSGRVIRGVAYFQWILLAMVGLIIGWTINLPFFITLAVLLIMGFAYNIPPLRTKDIPYLDVLSESANNPLRLFLGWFCVNTTYPPTLSLVLAYWMIGAFFMTVKRYAEYRRIGDKIIAARYRKSFSYYTEYRLILSMVYYASAFSLLFGIFIVRYRFELVLGVPFLAGIIPIYMRLGFWEDSPAQYPERLYKQRGLMIYGTFCLVLVMALLFIDLPWLKEIFTPVHFPGD